MTGQRDIPGHAVHMNQRAISSAGERPLHAGKAVGSIPTSPTKRRGTPGLRIQESGEPEPGVVVLNEFEQDDIMRRVVRYGPDECWPWRGAKSKEGYGRVKIGGKLYLPHRLVYAMQVGPIPPHPTDFHGHVVMHTCDNPVCCNPAHLKLGDHSENMKDMFRKGREPWQMKPGARITLRAPDGRYAGSRIPAPPTQER